MYLYKDQQYSRSSVGCTANLLITQFSYITGESGMVNQSLQEAGGGKGICKGNWLHRWTGGLLTRRTGLHAQHVYHHIQQVLERNQQKPGSQFVSRRKRTSSLEEPVRVTPPHAEHPLWSSWQIMTLPLLICWSHPKWPPYIHFYFRSQLFQHLEIANPGARQCAAYRVTHVIRSYFFY